MNERGCIVGQLTHPKHRWPDLEWPSLDCQLELLALEMTNGEQTYVMIHFREILNTKHIPNRTEKERASGNE